MVGKLMGSLVVLGLATSAQASSIRKYEFAELTKLSADQLTHFNSDLPFALNELQNCPKKTRDQIHFGIRINTLEITSDRSGQDTVTFTASGERRAPSGGKYEITIHLESKLVKRPGGGPTDAPPLRSYDCKIGMK